MTAIILEFSKDFIWNWPKNLNGNEKYRKNLFYFGCFNDFNLAESSKYPNFKDKEFSGTYKTALFPFLKRINLNRLFDFVPFLCPSRYHSNGFIFKNIVLSKAA